MRQAEMIERLGILRAQRHRPRQVRLRLLKLAQRHAPMPALSQQFDVIGMRRQRLRASGRRFNVHPQGCLRRRRHLTFQEYLAALEIAGWEDAAQHELLLGGDPPRIYRPEWREAVLLYGGLLHNMGPRKVDALLRKVLDKMGDQPTLASRAKCVGLIGALLPDLVGYTVADERYGESLRLVMDIFDAEKSKLVPFQDRLAAAEALGQAGDPRLKKHEWVTIQATRNYWIGAQKEDPKGRNYDEEAYDDETLREVNLARFRIGKYPVTVAQYLAFVEDGAVPDREPKNWARSRSIRNR